jgi:hypothetical protein
MIMGMFGASDALQGRYRKSVMFGSSFGILWAFESLYSTIILPPAWVLDFLYALIEHQGVPGQREPPSAFVYALVVTTLAPCPPELAAASALWIAGRYGFEFYHPLVDAPLSIATATLALLAFRYHDAAGSLVISAYIFYRVWTWPRIWDFNPGNLCTTFTLGVLVFGTAFLSALIVGSAAFYYFHGATLAHAWFICRPPLFPAQTKDPFSREGAEIIRSLTTVAGVLFIRIGQVLTTLHNS